MAKVTVNVQLTFEVSEDINVSIPLEAIEDELKVELNETLQPGGCMMVDIAGVTVSRTFDTFIPVELVSACVVP
jgi:hypothetical protein